MARRRSGESLTKTLAPSAPTAPQSQPATGRSSTGRVFQVVGEYKQIRRIGAGAFGEVWLGEAPGGTPVAIKIIQRPLDQKEAQQELEALETVKRLRHPFLVQTHTFSPVGERLHIVMELADSSLKDKARQYREKGEPGIPADELLGYFAEAAEAVDYLHANGVHHRDIKPANILLLGGHVKLADFGLARSLSAQKSMHDMTACGTPAYMGPEVWHGQIHSHTDQWSLAATYAELRLNRPLLGGTDLPSVMRKTLTADFDLEPLPEAEQQVLRKALAVDPHDRYPTCREFARALEEALHPPAPEPKPAPGLGRWPVLAAVAAVVLACAAAGAAAVFALNRPKPVEKMVTVPVVGQPTPQITFKDLSPLEVGTGSRAPFTLGVQCENYKGKIHVTPQGVPAGVTLLPFDIGEGQDKASVEVGVGPDVLPGHYDIILLGDAVDPAPRALLRLDVLYLPPGFTPGKEVLKYDNGAAFYGRMSRTVAGQPVTFVLVPHKPGRERQGVRIDPPTFYIMADKVSVGLFAQFAAENPEKVKTWKRPKDADPLAPALGMTVEEAEAFAEWLHGKLPGVEQWDKAAGRYEAHPAEGPYVGNWGHNPNPAVAVDLKDAPAKIGSARLKADSDRSPYGCHDMAGNGLEWTDTLFRGAGRVSAHGDHPRGDTSRVLLRGRDFDKPGPLTFEELNRDKNTLSCPYHTPEKQRQHIGFRVVIEPWGG